MKTKIAKVFGRTALGTALVLAGCTTPTGEPNYTGTGALVGAASGAGLGALVTRGNPAGAAIGGAAGLITGGLIGNSMDQAAKTPAYVVAPPPAPLAETVP